MSRALRSAAATVAGVLLVASTAGGPSAATGPDVPRIPEGEACPDDLPDPGAPAVHVDDRGRLQDVLDLDRAHELATGKGVGVAVVDLGVAQGSPTNGHFAALAHGRPSPGVGPAVKDPHGTMVAGLIAGRNGSEDLGVAPDAHLVSIKVADARAEAVEASDGELVGVDAGAVAAGIDEAVSLAGRHRIKVINLSLNLDRPDAAVTRAVRRALGRGILVVASVGNRPVDDENRPKPPWRPGEDAVRFPATVDGVLGATGLAADDTLAPVLVWTGRQVDVSAPSHAAVTVAPGGTTCRIADPGSSWAAAEVSGLAALLFEHVPGITPEQVATRIMATAQGAVEAGSLDGHGMIQPVETLTAQLDISRSGELRRAPDHVPPAQKATPPPLPGDENAPVRRALLWWGLGAGGLLIAALLLRPLARRRT